MVKLFCPVSGLQLYTQDDWRSRRFGNNFKANFYIIGRSILYSGPSGEADLESAVSVLRLSGEVARHVAGGTGNYIQIEDYAAFNKATIDARKHFIDQMISRDRVLSVIFCNLSPLMSLFVEIGKRFNTTNRGVYAVRNYKEAINLALKLCHRDNLATGSFVFGKQVTYRDDRPSLIPAELLSKAQWDIRTDDFTNRSVVIDRHILFSTGSGFFEETQLPLMNDMRRSVQDTLPSAGSLDYFMVDASGLKGASSKGRKLYMKSLKEWHERFPFRMYVTFGSNVFMDTAVRLAKALMPFKAVIAKNIDHAFELIQADKISKNLEAEKHMAGHVDPIQGYVEDLLAYIGGIEWEREGIDNPDSMADQNHPFYVVFQAIKLIKDELDDLFAAHVKIQEDLIESEKKYRELFEKGSDLLCFHDIEGNLIDTNIAFKKEYGWHGEIPIGLNIRQMIPERYRRDFDDYLDRIRKQGYDKGTMKGITADGREIVLEYNNILVKDSSGNPIGVSGSARDITDRIAAERKSRKLQEELKQKHKMEAIGTLTGGIAHEFNNILGIIIGNAELAIGSLPKGTPAKGYLSEIRSASLRAKDVVGHLLRFAHKSPAGREAIDIGTVVRDSIKVMRVALPQSVEIEAEIKPESGVIMADPTEIDQVIMNLCNNSVHAIGENQGTIKVGLESLILDGSSASEYEDLKPGRYAKLTIEDDGHGIDPKIMARIFDPYFTTKEVAQGLGMGLAIVYGIVNQLDGAIRVKSNIGEGTAFEILLPDISAKAV